MASNSGAIKAGRAYVEIFADKSALMRGLKAAEHDIRKWGTSISSMGKKMMGLGAGIVTPLIAAAKAAANLGHEYEHMSAITGASIEGLSGLAYAADQSGVSMEGLQKAFVFMHKNMFALGKGSKQAVQSFGALGLAAKDLSGLSVEEQFMLIADRLASIENPTQRAALALKVFGKAGASMLPLLMQGKGAINAYIAEAKRLGVVMTGEDAKAAADFYTELKKLWWVVKQGLVQAIGTSLIPMLKEWASKIVEVIATTAKWVRENKGVVRMAFLFGAGLIAAGGALVIFGNALIWVSKVLGVIHSAFGVLRGVLTWMLSPLGMIVVAIGAVTTAVLYFTGYGAQLLNWFSGCWTALKEDVLAAWGGIAAALAKGDLALAAKIAWLLVKMEWLKAKQWLLEIWYGVKVKVLEYWYAAIYGMVDAWNTGVYGIQVAWIETVSFLKEQWISFKQLYGDVVDWCAKKMFGLWVWWEKLLNPEFDDAGAKAAGEQQFAADAEKRAQQTVNDLEGNKAGAAAARADAKQKYDAQIAGSKQALYEDMKAVSDDAAANLKAVGDELAQAKSDFNAAIAKAKEPAAPTTPKPPPPKKDWNTLGMDKASSSGTFSAWGLGQMGVGGVMQKIADYTLRTAEATEDMADAADAGASFD